METFNGKLIVADPPDVSDIKREIEHISQKFDRLEFQVSAISQKNKEEYFQQICYVHLSLQKLERTYRRLLYTIIFSAIALASWYIWSGFNQNSAPVKQSHPTATSRSIQPNANR